MNPAAGVLAPAPGRLKAPRFRRPQAAERIRFFRSGRRAAAGPRLPFLLLAAPRVGFVPFLLVGTARLCLADPFHFRLGRRLGSPASGSCRLRNRLTGHRLARPASAAAVLLRPNGRHLAFAGAVGLRTAAVAALDLAGTVVYLVGLHGATALFR